jgi:hypothetical protein
MSDEYRYGNAGNLSHPATSGQLSPLCVALDYAALARLEEVRP